MLAMPSFIFGNNITQYSLPNDQTFTIPIIVSFPSLNLYQQFATNISPSNSILYDTNNANLIYNNMQSNNDNNDTKSEKNEKIDLVKRTLRTHFSKEEDEKIKELVNTFGKKNWTIIASFMKGRSPKQCRDRYCNYLVPGFFQGEWTEEEDELLLKLYNENGSKWSVIQNHFPQRSANSIKNRWYYFLRKKKDHNPKKSKNLEEFELVNRDNHRDKELNPFHFDNDKNNLTKNKNPHKNDEVEKFFEVEKEAIEELNENEWIAFD